MQNGLKINYSEAFTINIIRLKTTPHFQILSYLSFINTLKNMYFIPSE